MLKVGDKIKVRSDLIPSKMYDKMTFVKEMVGYKGKQANISKLIKSGINCFYTIDIDTGGWLWSEEMFENKPTTLRGLLE